MKARKVWGMQAHTISGNLTKVLKAARKTACIDNCSYELFCTYKGRCIRTLVVTPDGSVIEWNIKHDGAYKWYKG